MTLVLQIVFTVILIEAITNILSKSNLFEPVRKFFEDHNKFVYKLLDCPYCTSVWVSLFCVSMLYLYNINLLPKVVLLFFIVIVFHRLSNMWHFIIDRLDRNYVPKFDEQPGGINSE